MKNRMIFSLLCCFFSTFSSADEMIIPGTSVTLDGPEGFTLASAFSGLQSQDGSSITISELPLEAYEEFLAIFSNIDAAIEAFAQQGVTIESAKTVTAADQQVPVLYGTQSVSSFDIQKYVAIIRGETTVLLAFNVIDPDVLTELGVEHVIASVSLSPAATLEEKMEALAFDFRATAPFRATDVLAGSGVMMSSFEGIDPTGMKPAVVIVRAVSPTDFSLGPVALAELLLRNTQGFEGADSVLTNDTTFAGGTGNYLEAVTENRKIVQYLRIPDDGMYVRLIAFGAIDELDLVLEAVLDVADSVSIK